MIANYLFILLLCVLLFLCGTYFNSFYLKVLSIIISIVAIIKLVFSIKTQADLEASTVYEWSSPISQTS